MAAAARGNEVYWLFRGQAGTVRSLKAEVREPRDPQEEKLVNLRMQLPARKRVVIDVALALAGMVLEKPTASNAERVEAWCQEYMSSREAPKESGEIDPSRLDRELKALMEKRKRWDDAFGQLAMLFQQCRGWE